MKRKASKRGVVYLVIGALLLLIAGGWCLYNIIEDHAAGKQAAALLEELEVQQAVQSEETGSPVLMVAGDAFCGTVRIEKLGIELPVYDEWDNTRLKNAPCRYAGGIETDDLIIAAHNYKSQFGNLRRLQVGDTVLFTDAYGKIYRYEAKEITILDGTAVSDMKSGEWDFTLFTCTKGGEQRVTVRCDRI